MSYVTKNEVDHFDFEDAVIISIEQGLSSLHLYLDNVKILPENSTNRDIRMMRTNGMDLAIADARIRCLIDEGYLVYDVNGNLRKKVQDSVISVSDYENAFRDLEGAALDGIEKKDNTYLVSIRTDDHTVRLEVEGGGDTEKWERFMNL